uniref:CHK kinase-like domain-containing protein n=1 Tax=Musca domestica TaxID=7370 RepID=A0A1I8M6C8_MUSDO
MDAQNKLPTWIKAELFENVIKEAVGNYKRIENFEVRNALGPGENYATIMLRVKLELVLPDDSSREHTFMLKIAPDSQMYREQMSKLELFKTESGMYRDVVPEFEELYRNKGVNIRFGAKLYNLPVTNEEYLLLEDLSTSGFRNVKRQNGLDKEHAMAVLKKLAQWHAASAVRVAERGSYDKIYMDGFFNGSYMKSTEDVFDGMIPYILAVIRKLPHHEEYYGKFENKLRNLNQYLTEEIIENPHDGEFKVLNHGDFWCNNIMFQYNEDNQFQETYFVDYQMPRYGSVAQDLYYFLLSSTKLEIKVNCFDELIRYYHEQLIEHLKILEYSKPMPTLRGIHQSLLKQSVWAILTMCCIMSGVLCDPTDVASMENFIGNSEDGDKFKQLLYFNDRYLKHLEIILPWLHNRGVLDP